jgi:hypothetical protein
MEITDTKKTLDLKTYDKSIKKHWHVHESGELLDKRTQHLILLAESNIKIISRVFRLSNNQTKEMLTELNPEQSLELSDKFLYALFGKRFMQSARGDRVLFKNKLATVSSKYLKANQKIFNRLENLDFGLIVVRPEMYHIAEIIVEFVAEQRIEIVDVLSTTINFEKYLVMYPTCLLNQMPKVT